MTAGAHLDDEQLSALVDGAASSDEQSHAAACDECGARLDAWRDAIAVVAAAPPAPPAARTDAAVLAAMSEFDRWRDRRRVFTISRLAAAAAAVIVVAGVGVGLAQLKHGGSSKAASSGASTVAPAPPNASSAAPSGAASSGSGFAPNGAGSGLANYLGSFDSMSSVGARVRSDLRGATASAQPTAQAPTATPGCEPKAAAEAGVAAGTAPVLSQALTYQGAPAQVYVFDKSGRHVAVVEWTSGCRTAGVASF